VLFELLSVHICRTVTQVNLTAACNANCHCVSDVFEPVCGADSIVYFSPCYAGCLNTSADRKVVELIVLVFPFIIYLVEFIVQLISIHCVPIKSGPQNK